MSAVKPLDAPYVVVLCTACGCSRVIGREPRLRLEAEVVVTLRGTDRTRTFAFLKTDEENKFAYYQEVL